MRHWPLESSKAALVMLPGPTKAGWSVNTRQAEQFILHAAFSRSKPPAALRRGNASPCLAQDGKTRTKTGHQGLIQGYALGFGQAPVPAYQGIMHNVMPPKQPIARFSTRVADARAFRKPHVARDEVLGWISKGIHPIDAGWPSIAPGIAYHFIQPHWLGQAIPASGTSRRS